jgi:hypothetical protein
MSSSKGLRVRSSRDHLRQRTIASRRAHRRARVTIAAVATAATLVAFTPASVGADPHRGPLPIQVAHFRVPSSFSDRTIKVDLAERLTAAPQIIILGSSRAKLILPSQLLRETGHSGFNAAVNGIGGLPSAWAFVNYFHQRFPKARPRYLWFVDVETFQNMGIGGRLGGEPRLARYIPELLDPTQLAAAKLQIALDKARADMAAFTGLPASSFYQTRPALTAAQIREFSFYSADGGKGPRWIKTGNARLLAFQTGLAQTVSRCETIYRDKYPSLLPQSQEYFAKMLAALTSWGTSPVLVLTPVHPDLLAAIRPLGFDDRRQEAIAYIRSFAASYGFTLLDMTDISSFGGSPDHFYDGVHMDPVNNARLLDAIIERTNGAL